MIVTCASCLTKYNLDDSKVKPKGVKVRCSRCKHVFWVVPPPETKQEVIEKFEAFAKYHEELMEPREKEAEIAPAERIEKEEKPTQIEESLFEEKPILEEKKETILIAPHIKEEEKVEKEIPKPKVRVEKERRIFPFVLVGIIIVVLIIFAALYFGGDFGLAKRITGYLESPIEKVTNLWNRILGKEKEGLIIGNLNGYEEKVGNISLFIIEGKVNNQSRFTKKHIRLRISIFDRNKTKVAEKDVICGKTLTRGELKNLSPNFFTGDMVIKFNTDQEHIIPPGKEAPFMVIFKEIPQNATEFSVEIIEAPNI